MHEGFGMGFGVFMWLFWIIVIVVIVLVVKMLIGKNKTTSSTIRSKTALEILEERYSRGEIDHSEFEQKHRDLERS